MLKTVVKFRAVTFSTTDVFSFSVSAVVVFSCACSVYWLAERSSSRSTGLSYRVLCVMPPPDKSSSVKTRSGSRDDSDTLSTLSEQLGNIFKEMREFRDESRAMGQSIESTHEKIDEIKIMFNAHRADIDKCLNGVEDLREENAYLQKELEFVKHELCDLQQYSRRNTVDVQGVPEAKSENIFEVVRRVASVLRFDLKPEMVDAVHRLAGSSDGSRPRGIIVKFVRRGDCDELLRLAKVKKGFSASELNVNSDSKIYVNPSLSKMNRELLYLAKTAAREGVVKYVWFSNGKVLVRKKEGQPAIHISTRYQLQNLRRGKPEPNNGGPSSQDEDERTSQAVK